MDPDLSDITEETSFNSFLNNVIEDIAMSAKNTLNLLLEEWSIMYDISSLTAKQKLIDRYGKVVFENMSEIYKNEVKFRKDMEKKIEDLINTKNKLEKELDLPCQEANFTILKEQISFLEKLINSYNIKREERIQEYNLLRNRESELCHFLKEDAFKMKNELLTRENLEELKHYIFTLNELKIKRTSEFLYLKKKLQFLLSELNIFPKQYEQDILESENLTLSGKNLKNLQDVVSDYGKQLENATSEAESLKKLLFILWDKIDVQMSDRTNFLKTLEGHGPATFEKLHNELDRCETIKKLKIEPLTLKVREKIVKLWDSLTWTEEQRSFPLLHSSDFNESNLEKHESELERLEQLYSQHENLYKMAHERDTIWIKWLKYQCEETSKGKFKNRGGILLKEMKEKKKLTIKLNKIEKELKQLLYDYFIENATHFLWRGENLVDKIENDYAQYEMKKKVRRVNKLKINKENLKPERKIESSTPQQVRQRSDKKLMIKNDNILKSNINSKGRYDGLAEIFHTPNTPLMSSTMINSGNILVNKFYPKSSPYVTPVKSKTAVQFTKVSDNPKLKKNINLVKVKKLYS